MGCAASAGLGFLQFCNLNSFRSKFILGFSLFTGLSVSRYFNEYLYISGHDPVHTASTSVRIIDTQQYSEYLPYNSEANFLIFAVHTVQQHDASDFLVTSNRGNHCCVLLGLHSQSRPQRNAARLWQALVGEVPVF